MITRRQFGEQVKSFNRIVAVVAALALVVPLSGCKTAEEKEADRVHQLQLDENEKWEDRASFLVYSKGWDENKEKFTEGVGEDTQHFVVATTGEYACSPKFRLVLPEDRTVEAEKAQHYDLVAVVPTNTHEGTPVSELPPAFQGVKDLEKGQFNKLVKNARKGNKTLSGWCKNRP